MKKFIFQFVFCALAVTLLPSLSHAATFSDIGEFGTVRITHQWTTVNLNGTYNDPVVVAKSVSFNGGQQAHVRLRNVSSTSFDIRLEEWLHLDGRHTTESVPYIVVESGSHTINEKTVVAGRKANVSAGWSNVSFGSTVNSAIAFAQTQTYNGGLPVTIRKRNVSSSGFQTHLQREQGSTLILLPETVGFVAFEAGTYDTFQVVQSPDEVTHNWYTIPNPANRDIELLLADDQTRDGADPADVRHRVIDNKTIQLMLHEDTAHDTEIGHTTEVAGYIVQTSTIDMNSIVLSVEDLAGNLRTEDIELNFITDVTAHIDGIEGNNLGVSCDLTTVGVDAGSSMTVTSFPAEVSFGGIDDDGDPTASVSMTCTDGIQETTPQTISIQFRLIATELSEPPATLTQGSDYTITWGGNEQSPANLSLLGCLDNECVNTTNAVSIYFGNYKESHVWNVQPLSHNGSPLTKYKFALSIGTLGGFPFSFHDLDHSEIFEIVSN